METVTQLEALQKLSKDIKKASVTLSDKEARYLVDTYYQMQEYRKRSNNQCRSLIPEESEAEPNGTIQFFADNFETLEKNCKSVLQAYVLSKPIGIWLNSICGIGPVISAGLMAHIDITKCETAGTIWNYAGLNPNAKWEKGQLRPWNASLKTLCWKIGQSFVKVSHNDNDYYGKIYQERKLYEVEKNNNLEYKDQAEKVLSSKNIGKDTEAYKWYSKGMLPPAHIQQRAERYATKLFLSHLFEVWYRLDRGENPPKPFAVAILGHAHEIKPPNLGVVGLE